MSIETRLRQLGSGGASATAIGLPVIGGSPNLILFIDSSGNLAIDQRFYFNSVTNRMVIGATGGGSGKLELYTEDNSDSGLAIYGHAGHLGNMFTFNPQGGSLTGVAQFVMLGTDGTVWWNNESTPAFQTFEFFGGSGGSNILCSVQPAKDQVSFGTDIEFGAMVGIMAFHTTDSSLVIEAMAAQSGRLLKFLDSTASPLTYVDVSGNIGLRLGASNTSAYLHIAAGTASAGTAPLKLTSGSLLSAPEVGAIEFLTDRLYISDSTTRYPILVGSLGFTGGTTLIGGTATTDDLILQSTSGNGASGTDILFKTGNNGGTTAGQFHFDGTFALFGIAVTPTSFLHVNGVQPASVASTPGTNATAVCTILGPTGGNTTATSAPVGGVGSLWTITSGAGGTANSGTSGTPTGGAGGAGTCATGSGGSTSISQLGIISKGGNGGQLSLNTGAGGTGTNSNSSGSATGGNGGAVSMQAGSGGSATAGSSATGIGGTGGNVTLAAGTGGTVSGGVTQTAGVGGTMTVAAGTGGGVSTGTAGAGGAATFRSGNGGSSGSVGGGAGGTATFTAGSGGSGSFTTAGNGGATTLSGGNGGTANTTQGLGGNVTVQGGSGGGSASIAGAAGGTCTVTGGTGGASSNAATGAGGNTTVTGGTGGTPAGGSASSGAAGTLTLRGGTGGGGSVAVNGAAGGLVTVSGGTGGQTTTQTSGAGGELRLTGGVAGSNSGGTSGAGGIITFQTAVTTSLATCGNIDKNGRWFLGGATTATAVLHLAAGTTAASTAPLKFTSGTSMTNAEAGAVEFTTDDLFFTITTGAARKAFVLDDGTRLTSGRVPFATTNGRLVDDSDMTFSGSRLTVTDLTSTNAPIVSSLTAGRVVFAGASKELVDDADMTFATDTLTVTGLVIGTTKLKTYNGVNTVSNGVGSIVATVDLTTQGAAIAATTAYAVPASGAGMYQVTWVATVTQAATTSSVLGGTNGFQLKYTDADDSVVKTSAPTTVTAYTSAGNTTGTQVSGSFVAYCKASTNLQYIMDYTSVGGTVMQYNLHIKVIWLG